MLTQLSKLTIGRGPSNQDPEQSSVAMPLQRILLRVHTMFQTKLMEKTRGKCPLDCQLYERRLIRHRNTPTAASWDRRKMPNPSSSSPSLKQGKAKQATLPPEPKRTDTHDKFKVPPTPARALGAWGNFAAHIAQDDKDVAVKASEMLKKQEASKFRPEFRETYKDQKGKKETTVHEGVAGLVGPVTNESQNGDDTSKMEKKTPGDVHVGDHGDDAGLYKGGVAL